MARPKFITQEDIDRWNKAIENTSGAAEALSKPAVTKELFYAGLYLREEVEKLNCPLSLINKIQYRAAFNSFGTDSWNVHITALTDYLNNKIDIEDISNNSNLN